MGSQSEQAKEVLVTEDQFPPLTKYARGKLSANNARHYRLQVARSIGGSLLSLGGKEKKNLKKIAEKVSNKVEKVGNKAKKSVSTLKLVCN